MPVVPSRTNSSSYLQSRIRHAVMLIISLLSITAIGFAYALLAREVAKWWAKLGLLLSWIVTAEHLSV